MLLIGADPELFVMKNGSMSSMAGILGYNKINKLDTGKGIRLQEDNVLLEFDIDPCSTYEKFQELMQDALFICKDVAKKYGLEISLNTSSHNYSKEELLAFPDSAKEFGCSSDLNALTGMVNPIPTPRRGLRTAGGHVHIGFLDELNIVDEYGIKDAQLAAGILCDYLLGLPSLLEDDDSQRRELYGKAGAIRLKDYGIEYRTLSNYWISTHTQEIWDRSNKVVELIKNNDHKDVFMMINPQEVQRTINENDKAMAEQYLRILETV